MSKYTIDKYREALVAIAESSDQANAIHLKVVAQTALDFEDTTADEFNVPVITGDKDTDALLEDERINQDEDLKSQQESLDRYRETQAEIAEYDKKLSEEAAESEWRGTVLHPEYKSPFAKLDEEE
tara:strand:- start:3453 stop:3830 length:378 start_codon:yes stop_codon:yes gene_type:complete